MKLVSTILFVSVCFAGGVAASTQPSTAAKVQRFANPELCFLDIAANDQDASLVRAELQRRNVVCTSELRAEGRQALEKSVRMAILQDTRASLQRVSAAREYRERQDILRQIRCTQDRQNSSGCPGF